MYASESEVGTTPSASILGDLRKRLPLAAALFAFAATGYFTVGLHTDPARAHSLRTAADDAIPFIPWTILGYAWCYTVMMLPLFVIRSAELFRRTLQAYFAILVFSFASFIVYPVTSLGFRPDLSTLSLDNFFSWAARTNLSLDPPYNLFPSLHLSIATIAAVSAWKARRLFGVVAFGILAVIAVSICTVKQHFIADGLAGLVLAGAVSRWLLLPYRSQIVPVALRAYSWRGLAAYLLFHTGFYATFVLAFLKNHR